MSGQILPFVFAHQRGKVCHFSKSESATYRREHVVLMTWQNVTWSQSFDGFSKSLATVGKRDSKNRKIDIFDPQVGRRARNAPGIDVNSFAGGFDHKRKRLTHTPVRNFYWLRCASTLTKRSASASS